MYDDSGEIEVTVFGDEGEKIMQMSAEDFLDKYCNDESLLLDTVNSKLHCLQLKVKIQSKLFTKQDGTTTLSHTMQALECHQLPSSSLSKDDPFTPSLPEATDVLPSSASAIHETKPYSATGREHPHPDIHGSTSSRGRALKTRRAD